MKIIVKATSTGCDVKVEEAVGSTCQTTVEGLAQAIGAKVVATELKPEFYQVPEEQQQLTQQN